MRTLSEAAKAAALIRKHLKKHNIKASVTSDNYSMGSSVDVTIKQDTLPAMVQDIKNYCAQYQYGHFDGMTDCYEYSNRDENLPQAKFVSVSVQYSKAIREKAKMICEQLNIDNWDMDTHIWRLLNGSHSLSNELWREYKPRIKA